jgi:type IV secretory pathway VirD2 relaxase
VAQFVKVARAANLGKARAHVKYIAFRSRELPQEERGAFDKRTDHADVGRFNEKLEDYMTRHPMANKAYKMTVSLSEREFRERGLTSWKPIVREVMANLEKQWGREFQWIASEHMAKGHPHVHIVIKATCVDQTGRYRQLRLDKADLQDIKKEFGRVLERYRVHEREQERDRSLSRGDMLMRAFESALRALSGAAREDDHDSEQEHQKWLRKQRDRARDDDRGR